jgi:hypothetical protein
VTGRRADELLILMAVALVVRARRHSACVQRPQRGPAVTKGIPIWVRNIAPTPGSHAPGVDAP